MSTGHCNQRPTIASLPDSALLHAFQLVCDSCAPDAPGTCWLSPVCKHWRRLSNSVEGLRVVFQGKHQQQQVASFRSWLRRYAGRSTALAIASDNAVQVLRALVAAAAIAAGAASKPLPLQRLVVVGGELLHPEVCQDVLHPLLATLPGLEHLHLSLATTEILDEPEAAVEAAAGALAPLQHNTNLTSMVLDGPTWGGSEAADAAHVQLLASLPPSLRSLTWRLITLQFPEKLCFKHLTGLTHLSLGGPVTDGYFAEDAFTGLHHLRKLELNLVEDFLDEGLLEVKEQLVGLTIGGDGREVLGQLTRLQSLRLPYGLDTPQLLQQAPPLQQLHVLLKVGGGINIQTWSSPWALQHYRWGTSLQRLELETHAPMAAPLELCAFRQLQQLSVNLCEIGRMEASIVVSWAFAVAGLVNLEVLTVPAALTACPHPWLTGLPRLVVLEVVSNEVEMDMASAATHISRLLASGTGSSRGMQQQVQVVCCDSIDPEQAAQLHAAVAAAVPVLPPNKHLFRGSWQLLQDCGLELWPAPVAARLQQLLLG
jgi:hypothetical protein